MPIDCAQLGLGARSRMLISSNVNGACMSHVSGKTGARQIIEGSIGYGPYSWTICGWTWNSRLRLTVASCANAAEAKMSIDPVARANCKDFRMVFLRRKGTPARSLGTGAGLPSSGRRRDKAVTLGAIPITVCFCYRLGREADVWRADYAALLPRRLRLI
jgi:hypothetical protein